MARAAYAACLRRCCRSQVRFVDFLKTTVLLSAGAATALATITVLVGASALNPNSPLGANRRGLVGGGHAAGAAPRSSRRRPVLRSRACWRGPRPPPHCPSTTQGPRSSTAYGRSFCSTVLAGGLGFLAPQIPASPPASGIIWALAWRRQDAAVAAIEERDGARFYVRRTSPVRPMELDRTPGFKALRAGAGGSPSTGGAAT